MLLFLCFFNSEMFYFPMGKMFRYVYHIILFSFRKVLRRKYWLDKARVKSKSLMHEWLKTFIFSENLLLSPFALRYIYVCVCVCEFSLFIHTCKFKRMCMHLGPIWVRCARCPLLLLWSTHCHYTWHAGNECLYLCPGCDRQHGRGPGQSELRVWPGGEDSPQHLCGGKEAHWAAGHRTHQWLGMLLFTSISLSSLGVCVCAH